MNSRACWPDRLSFWCFTWPVFAQGLLLLGYTYANYFISGLGQTPDSQQYLSLKDASIIDILSSHRTIGYPLLLHALSALSPELGLLPAAQVLMHVIAVATFTWFLGERVGQAPLVLLLGSTALWSNTALDFATAVLTDLPGQSSAVATVAGLLAVTSKPRALNRWVLLGLALLASYQIRPAYQFLVPLSPILALWLLPSGIGSRRFRDSIRFAGLILAAALIPLGLFSALRGLTVGHFGLTSFLGTNVIGIAGQLINENEAGRELEGIERLIAVRAIQARDADWARLCCSNLPLERQAQDRTAWNQRYIATVRGFIEAAVAIAPGAYTQTDRLLLMIGLRTIRNHPLRFFFYVAREVRYALRQLLSGQFMFLPVGLAGVFCLLKAGWPGAEGWSAVPFTRLLEPEILRNSLRTLAPIALLFAGSKTLLVCALEPALDRYVDAAAVFLPGLLVLVIATSLSSGWAPRDGVRNE